MEPLDQRTERLRKRIAELRGDDRGDHRDGDRGVRALIVLGSGMSGCFADDELDVIDEERSAVAGHAGRLALMRPGRDVLVALGRRHFYEGHESAAVTETVRLGAALGARDVLLANAAGGLSPRLRTGGVMLITGTLASLLGRRAAVSDAAAPKFAAELYPAIIDGAAGRGVRVGQGIYAALMGPSYETRAEIRMLRRIGADAVGMSTAIEAAAATALGMRVVSLSLISNTLSDTAAAPLDHADVVEQGRRAASDVRAVLEAWLAVVG